MLYNLDMRSEWTFLDFVREYVLKVVGLWLIIFSAFSSVVHLIIKFWLGKDIPIEYWIIFIGVGVFIAQSVVYYRIARRQIPGERIENDLKRISNLRAYEDELHVAKTKRGFPSQGRELA